MSKLAWDASGARRFEAGVDQGVLYVQNNSGAYPLGVAWNGLTGLTESPGGAELTDLWADNQKYASLRSAETFGGTIEAYTYPDEFAECDGSAELLTGVMLGQQARKTFGLCYRTRIGTDVDTDLSEAYKLHLIYGASANPSEKAYTTINDSPEGITFSWEITTTPVSVTGFKPTASIVIDSTKVNPTKLAALEDILYGAVGADPYLPLPNEVKSVMLGTDVQADATFIPTFDAINGVLTVPSKTGVDYKVDGVTVVSGVQPAVVGGVTIVVTMVPKTGYYIANGVNTTWTFLSTNQA